MEALTLEDCGLGRRGVLASYDDVTPTRRSEDLVKSKVGLRDLLILLVGAAGMWGTQVATQSKTQGAIENLGTKVDGYMQTQANTNSVLNRDIADARQKANLAIINDATTSKELAELKGYLMGVGIKVPPNLGREPQ